MKQRAALSAHPPTTRARSHLLAPASTDLACERCVERARAVLHANARYHLGVLVRAAAHPISLLIAGALALGTACKDKDRYRNVEARDGGGMGGSGADASATKDGSAANGGSSGRRDGGGGIGGIGAVGGDNPFDGMIPEGATMDAAVLGLDGGLDLPPGSWFLGDGAIVLPDGRVLDVDAALEEYPKEIDVSTCEIGTEDTWNTQVDIFDEGGFALVPGQVGFGLAYRGGRVAGCAQTLNAMPLGSSGGFGEPQLVDTQCKVLTDVGLMATLAGWRIAWVDNFTNMAELHTLELDATMGIAPGAERVTLTNNDGKREHKPVMHEIAGMPMIAWISEDVRSRARSILTQKLDGSSVATTVLAEDEQQTPQSLAFTQMADASAALAWVGPLDSPGVWLQPLDREGAANGGRINLTEQVAASSSVDMATRTDGGGVVYSIEIDELPQVRFRRLDSAGMPVASERSIIGPPLRAQGASLATLGGGYAVTYRALPGGSVTSPEIRLTFVSKEGNVQRDADGRLLSFRIGDATMAQGRTAVSVSVEGEIMVAWVDADTSTGRNVLRVVRRHLACQ